MAGNPTVQDILRRFYPKYLEEYTPNARQAKAAGPYPELQDRGIRGECLQMRPVRPYPDT